MPWAEGPIDVDNPKDYALVTRILKGIEGDLEGDKDGNGVGNG